MAVVRSPDFLRALNHRDCACNTEALPRRIPRNAAPSSEQERSWDRQGVDQTVSSSLMKRYGTTEEQATAILFLASDEASYITGVTLPVAGGGVWCAGPTHPPPRRGEKDTN